MDGDDELDLALATMAARGEGHRLSEVNPRCVETFLCTCKVHVRALATTCLFINLLLAPHPLTQEPGGALWP